MFVGQTICARRLGWSSFACLTWKQVPRPPKRRKKAAGRPSSIYYTFAPEIVPQCSIQPLPLGHKQGQFVAPYQKTLVLPYEFPGKRNKLNIKAFQPGKYPIMCNLFVVVKQIGQIKQQASVAFVNLLLTQQGYELITQAGFVKIRSPLHLVLF